MVNIRKITGIDRAWLFDRTSDKTKTVEIGSDIWKRNGPGVCGDPRLDRQISKTWLYRNMHVNPPT
jgi:hypothetical protein